MWGVLLEPIMVGLRWLGVIGGGTVVAGIVWSVLARLAIMTFYFTIMQAAEVFVSTALQNEFTGQALAVVNAMQFLGVFQAINIIMSATYYRFVVKTAVYNAFVNTRGFQSAFEF